MKYAIVILAFVTGCATAKTQTALTDAIYGHFMYEQAFEQLECMLKDTCQRSFKEAVFTVENAYYNGYLDRQWFDIQIDNLSKLVKALASTGTLVYEGRDKGQMEKNAALFSVLCDSIPIRYYDTIVYHPPFRYDFNDMWGAHEWSSTFVSKLLETHTGNCHSMPYLYKILSGETGAKAHLALAPSHLYIKHSSEAFGWYNTELTSAAFPVDAWLMASGYIHLDAVVNRLYMEALSEKQTLAMTVVDLAQGYGHRFGYGDGAFILECCDLALEFYPHYINALLLKAETKRRQFFAMMEKNFAEYPSQAFDIPEAKALFDEMEALYIHIHEMGYRAMPEEMYLQWLSSLNEQRDKYQNRNISGFKNQSP